MSFRHPAMININRVDRVERIVMTLRTATLGSALLFGLTLILGAGSAVAGDGKSCGGKKKDGESAAVMMPAQPRA
jgi:hypothetical protein